MSVNSAHAYQNLPTQLAFVNNRSNDVPCAFSLNVVLGVLDAPVQEFLQECTLIIHWYLDLFQVRRRDRKYEN
jgi:hypothetical protein